MPDAFCFDKEQRKCLQMQNRKLEGKTEKQKNPYRKGSLRCARWIIARSGECKGYASERKPDITILWTGFERFYNIFKGWKLARDAYKRWVEVCDAKAISWLFKSQIHKNLYDNVVSHV
jgi:hypothetical protein